MRSARGAVATLAEKRRYWHINEERWCTDENAVEVYKRVVEARHGRR